MKYIIISFPDFCPCMLCITVCLCAYLRERESSERDRTRKKQRFKRYSGRNKKKAPPAEEEKSELLHVLQPVIDKICKGFYRV
jgi:hypothetical protein